jgi:hypothetical protein
MFSFADIFLVLFFCSAFLSKIELLGGDLSQHSIIFIVEFAIFCYYYLTYFEYLRVHVTVWP